MKKFAAVFTIVKNEKYFLPIWYKYYSKYFPKEDIYVLDHQTNDGSTLNLDCNVRVVKNDKAFDANWLKDTVNEFQKHLLEKYEFVIFTEIDEILISLENQGYDLYEHLVEMKNLGKNFDVATGYEMMQDTVFEAPYNSNNPILNQRRKWYREAAYDKTLISRVPLDWGIGFHDTIYRKQSDWVNGDNLIDPNDKLILIHLHKFDYQIYMKRKMNMRSFNMAIPSFETEGYQQRFSDIKDMRDFFYSTEGRIEDIPSDFPIVI
jgi:hypothetical protein